MFTFVSFASGPHYNNLLLLLHQIVATIILSTYSYYQYDKHTTVEPLYKDTPEMRTPPALNQDTKNCAKGVRNRGIPLCVVCE